MKAIIALAAMLALAGCAVATDLIEKGRPYASSTAAELALASCSLPIEERKKNAAAVAEKLAKQGSVIKFMLDCDGDGLPDFGAE